MVVDFSSPSLRKINVVTVWPDEGGVVYCRITSSVTLRLLAQDTPSHRCLPKEPTQVRERHQPLTALALRYCIALLTDR